MADRWETDLLSQTLIQYGVILLAALSIGGIAYVLVMPFLSGERKASKRVAAVAKASGHARLRASAQQPLQTRRKQVEDTIKDIEAKEKAKKRINLRTRLMRAGLSISPRTYYILSIVSGLLGFFVVLLTGSSLVVSLLAAFVFAFGFPRFVLSRLTKRRHAKFLHDFANAIDIIVRGIKSGLPLADCLQIIANEAPEPVRSEFVDLVEQQRIGVPLPRAFERMYDRVPLQEVNFFATVIAIQAQTGGNLAEALGNLSQVLRDRYRLQARVKALGAEAKASAWILGVLPPGVMLIVYLTTPQYIGLLFHSRGGNLMLIVSAVWMLIGILVMRKMINFEY
jgi:tight adherence protein B